MSMMQRADFSGLIVISAVVVLIVTQGPDSGEDGVAGCVRSKPVLLS